MKKLIIVLFITIITGAGAALGLTALRSVSYLSPDNSIFAIDHSYNLAPKNINPVTLNSIIEYPFAKISPLSWKYVLVLYQEYLSLRSDNKDRGYYASKRISELEKWGDELTVQKSASIHNANELRQWWQRHHGILDINKNNEWEYILARYLDLIETKISQLEISYKGNSVGNDTDWKQRYEELNAQIVSNKNTVTRILYHLNRPAHDKEYLTILTNSIFNYLQNRLHVAVEQYDTSHITYSTLPVITNNSYGIYDISLTIPPRTDKDLFTSESMFARVGSTTFPASLIEKNSYSRVVFKDIPIDRTTTSVQLTFPQINLNSAGTWIAKESPPADNNEYIYRYTMTLPPVNTKDQYAVTFPYKFHNVVTVHMEKDYIQYKKDRRTHRVTSSIVTDVLDADTLLPSPDINNFIKSLDFSQEKRYSSVRIILSSPQPLDTENNVLPDVKLSPVFNPMIYISKKRDLDTYKASFHARKTGSYEYMLTVVNTSKEQDAYLAASLAPGWKVTSVQPVSSHKYLMYIAFWPAYMLRNIEDICLIIAGALLIYIYVKLRAHGNKTWIERSLIQIYHTSIRSHFILLRIGEKILHCIQQLCEKVRFTALVLFIIFIPFSILYLDSRFSTVFIVSLPLLLTINIGYRFNPRELISVSMFFLLLSMLAFIMDWPTAAEKCIFWFLISFMSGCCLMPFQSSDLYKKPMFLRIFVSIISEYHNFIAMLQSNAISGLLLVTPLVYVKNIIIRVYGLPPRTRREKQIVAIKIIFTVLILITLHSTYVIINTAMIRKSLDPVITSVEPHIVYSSNKVIIRGKNFDWKQNEDVRLVNQFGEVPTDFWSDNKIIFTVPLHWPKGDIYLAVKKPIQWQGKPITATSRVVKIFLIPITNHMNKNDDAYQEQLKTLSPETLKLNGY